MKNANISEVRLKIIIRYNSKINNNISAVFLCSGVETIINNVRALYRKFRQV